MQKDRHERLAARNERAHVSAQDESSNFTHKMRNIALVVVSLGFVMDLLDSTIVNIAIPSIQSNLGASYSAIQWLIAGYALSFAVLLVTGGRMGDVYGYKKLFMIGVGGFTLASLLSGLAWNPGALIAARLLQGSMAALMVPQVMSLMQVMFKPSERGAINGLFGMLGGISASLGPIIGGFLIKANLFNLDWRPIFLINVPVGIFALVMAAKYLPNGKSAHPLRLDLSGTFIIILAMLLLIYPLIQGRELGWPTWSFASIALSVPLFVTFAWWQKRKERNGQSPLVLPALFRNRSFGVGLAINLVFEGAMVGFFLTFGLLQQIGLGFTPLHAALTGLPVAVGIALTMALVGEKLVPKLGRYALSTGCAIMAVGLMLTDLVARHYLINVHSWQLIPGLLIVGVGMGFVFGSLFAAVLNGVDSSHAGSASGILNAVQQVGGAIGIALIGVVFFGQLSHNAANSFTAIDSQLVSRLQADQVPESVAAQITAGARQCFIDRSKEKDSSIIPASCKQHVPLSALPSGADQRLFQQTISQTVSQAAQAANSHNFASAFHWSVVYDLSLLLITYTLSMFLPRRFRTDGQTAAG